MKSLWATGRNLYLPLRALHEAFASQPAGSHGDPRLALLVAVTLRIQVRVDERGDPRLLVVLERKRPRHRRHEHGSEREDGNELHPQPGQIGDAEAYRNQGDGGPKIWLTGNQEERHACKSRGHHQVAGIPGAAAVFAEEHRQHQRQRDAGELRGLQVEWPDIDPARGIELGRTLEQHVDEEPGQRDVGDEGVLRQLAVVDGQADEERDETDSDGVNLGQELRSRVRRLGHVNVGRAVNHRDADAGDDEDRPQQQPVDVKEQAALEHRLSAAAAWWLQRSAVTARGSVAAMRPN